MRLTPTAIVYGLVVFATIARILNRRMAGILNQWDVIFGLLGILWAVAAVMEVLSEETQHPIILPIAIFEIWLLSITLFDELIFTGFGRYMPIRLPLSFYAYYAILIIGASAAYWSGVTSPSPKIKVSTKLALGIPLALWAIQIFLSEIFGTLRGYGLPLWVVILGGLFSAIAIWLIITAKRLLSKSKKLMIKTGAFHAIGKYDGLFVFRVLAGFVHSLERGKSYLHYG